MRSQGDIPAETLRPHLHRVADWIADYRRDIESHPVLSRLQPGELRAALPASPPVDPEPLEEILQDFEDKILPGITHWNHPGFHGYFAISGSGPGILAEALAAALNVNGMLWRTSPAVTELEALTLDWLRQMLGLPEAFDGHINDTASVSTLVALAAAREAATEGDVRSHGLTHGPRLRLYASEEAHSSVEKAAILLGLGQEGVRRIPTDAEFRMEVSALEEAVARDREAGDTPMAVVGTVGTTSTTSVDPIGALADVCSREGMWLHVDGAYGGAMAVVEEFRWVLDGVEHADSFVINPHKWLFVPIDCSALYCRHPRSIRQAFSLVSPYLMTPEDDRARNLMDYGPALGRRFRALKLWMVLRAFGTRGIAQRIGQHVEMAQAFAAWVDGASDWERMAPAPMSTVLFRHRPQRMEGAALDEHNRRLRDALNATGFAFLSDTLVRGAFALRLAVGNLDTTLQRLEQTWLRLQEIATTL